jgi:hypothetical protein
MSSKSSAFKTQNEKRYGSVEKMYIHFYTFVTTEDTNKLDIIWYCNDTENIELFSDIKHYANTLKSYGYYTTYTGDIFVVKNLHKFKEILILLGADKINETSWPLQGNATKEVNIWQVAQATKFNELFDICFQDYEITNSFSSEPSLAKNRIEMDEFIRKFDIDTGFSEKDEHKNQLIEVTFGNETEIMKFYQFNQLPFTVVKSRLDNTTILNWFDTLVKKSEYQTAYTTIKKLIDFNSKEDTSQQIEEEEDDDDDVTVMTEQESAKISHDEWIKLFNELYLEEDKGSDILLSDTYQLYVTASSWTNTATVSMATFIKRLRALNKFTIKRRAKGMMIIGYKCLVNQQADFFQQVKKGQLYKRQILHYKSDLEIQSILKKYSNEIQNIGHKYAREIFILLNDTIQLDYQTVSQFASIPQISTQLPLYAEYIDSIIKITPIYETLSNGTKVRKFNTEVQKPLEDFRELGNKCTLYYPFVLGKNNITARNYYTYDLTEKSGNEVYLGPTAFNEHFGMFLSSKEYHLFEPEKGTPQEYNNMIGTPLDSVIGVKTDTKNYTIWKEGTRVVPSFDLRANGKLAQ